MPESSLGGVPTFCLCGLHDSLTYEYLKKSCKTSLFHFYLIIINIMLLFIRTSQAEPSPNRNNTITHGPRPECSPHARPVPPPSYGIPCSLLGQRPGAFNCPLSVVMEEKFFFSTFRALFTPSVRVPIGYRGHFSSPLRQYIAIKYFSWIFAFSPLRNASSGVAEKGACPDGGERPM